MIFSRSFNRYENLPSLLTLVNSSVGIVCLAMPYCFQQCGVFLSVLLLICTGFACTASCDLIIKLCLTHKSATLEKTCFRYLGLLGKLLAELSIIGLMFGFAIGYNVSLADLGTGIVAQIFAIQSPENLRVSVLAVITLFLIPLCFVPQVKKLARASAFAMFFYSLMIFHIFFVLGMPKLIKTSALRRMVWWRPAGLLKCLPIFLASIFCQTQLHTIYASLRQPSPSAMRILVRMVITIIILAYTVFGFFGYAAFVEVGEIAGNVFIIYPMDSFSLVIKLGFMFTVMVSIPLILFPLRQSLDSFIHHQGPSLMSDMECGEEACSPTKRFRLMTLCILGICFALSLTTDKIELIIQLTSSLAGSLIGYLLPALVAIYALTHNKSSHERRVATSLLFVGLLLLVSGLVSLRSTIDQPVPAPNAQPAIVDVKGKSSATNPNKSIQILEKTPQQPLVIPPHKHTQPDDPNAPRKLSNIRVPVKAEIPNKMPVIKSDNLAPAVQPVLQDQDGGRSPPVVKFDQAKQREPNTIIENNKQAPNEHQKIDPQVVAKPIDQFDGLEPKQGGRNAALENNKLAPNDYQKVDPQIVGKPVNQFIDLKPKQGEPNAALENNKQARNMYHKIDPQIVAEPVNHIDKSKPEQHELNAAIQNDEQAPEVNPKIILQNVPKPMGQLDKFEQNALMENVEQQPKANEQIAPQNIPKQMRKIVDLKPIGGGLQPDPQVQIPAIADKPNDINEADRLPHANPEIPAEANLDTVMEGHHVETR